VFAILIAFPVRAHLDHGIGGERIRFEPIPSLAKPQRAADRVFKVAPPPNLTVTIDSLSFKRGLTISAWLYKADSTTSMPVLSDWGPLNRGAFSLSAGGGPGSGFQLRWQDGATSEVTGYTVPDERWVHYLASYDGQLISVYLDGVLVGSQIAQGKQIADCAGKMAIGYDSVAGSPARGRLDDVVVWDRSLTREEIARVRAEGEWADAVWAWSFEEDASEDLEADGDPQILFDDIREGRVAHFEWHPYIEIDPERVATIEDQITISAWLYNRGVSRLGGPVISRWGVAPEDRSFVLYSVGGDGFGFRAFWADGTQNNLTVVETPAEEWFHLAATYDGRELRLFVNGVAAGRTIAVSKVFAKGAGRTLIGSVGSDALLTFKGYLDEVGLWHRALPEDEVLTVMKGGPEIVAGGLLYSNGFDLLDNESDVTLSDAGIGPSTLAQASAAGKTGPAKAILTKEEAQADVAFWWAATHDQHETAAMALDHGADINAKMGIGGHSALHAAVRDRRIETVQFLIAKGADANLRDETFRSPAWGWADHFGLAVLKTYLLDAASETDLYAAVLHDAPDRVSRLLNLDHEQWNLERALRSAAGQGRPEIIEMLLQAGADPHARDGGGRSPEDLAVARSRYESVDVLRKWRGLDVSGDSSYLARVDRLDGALGADDLSTLRSLLSLDPAVVHSDPSEQRTWLQRAADADNSEAARLLLAKGAAFDRVRSHHTALSWAVTIGAYRVAEEILLAGERADLFTSAGLGRIEDVKGFFVNGRVRDDSSFTGSTRHDENREVMQKPPYSGAERVSDALYIASRNGREEVARFLLSKGADPNFRAARGGTALYWAAREGHAALVELLLEANADASVPDRYGLNALQIGARSENARVRAILAGD
jgi:ankyrin repeat protein